MFFGLGQLPRHTSYQEFKMLGRLTYPMLLAQCAQVSIGFIELVLVGSLGQTETAALSIGSTIFFTVWVMLLGAISSISAMVARQYGQYGVQPSVGEVGQQGLWYGLLLSVIGMLLLALITFLLRRYLDMPTAIVDETCQFIFMIMLGLPGSMLYCAATEYTASLQRTKIIMVTNLLALCLNIPLDYILIHGLLGAPQMGASGCGVGRAVTYWFNGALILLYIAQQAYYQPFGLFRRFVRPNIEAIGRFLRIGIFSGFSYLLEMCLITTVTLIGTHFGAAYVVSQNIVINFCSILYMIPQSFAVALSIRISENIGKNQPQNARALCGIGLLVGLAVSIIACIGICLMRYPIMQVYSNDTTVVLTGVSLFWLGSLFLVFNGLQTVASGALRGYKKTIGSLLIHGITYLGIGVPLAYCLALPTIVDAWLAHALVIGAKGAWLGTVAALLAASIALFAYLSYVSQQKQID